MLRLAAQAVSLTPWPGRDLLRLSPASLQLQLHDYTFSVGIVFAPSVGSNSELVFLLFCLSFLWKVILEKIHERNIEVCLKGLAFHLKTRDKE